MLPSGVALKLLCLWGGAEQPPPRFESNKAANFIAITVAWGILCNRCQSSIQVARMAKLCLSTVGRLAQWMPSMPPSPCSVNR